MRKARNRLDNSRDLMLTSYFLTDNIGLCYDLPTMSRFLMKTSTSNQTGRHGPHLVILILHSGENVIYSLNELELKPEKTAKVQNKIKFSFTQVVLKQIKIVTCVEYTT